MIQLTFQAALDPFHSVFRLLRLRGLTQTHELYRDQLRILDFYMVFPFRVDEIRLTREQRTLKKLAADYASQKPYGELPDSNVLFDRMRPISDAAMATMAARGFYETDALERGDIRDTKKATPAELQERIATLNAEQANLLEFLNTLASSFTFFGPEGLKARTGLIEHRYDSI